MSVPATDAAQISTPSGDAGAGASAPGAGSVSSGEPTASSEPTAPTTAPTTEVAPSPQEASTAGPAPTFPSSDEYGWDSWDGAGLTLPEEIQGWFGKFNDRFTSASDARVAEHTAALGQANANTDQYRRMYEHLATGMGDDPQLTEANASVERLTAELAAAGTKFGDYEKQVDTHMEAEAERYIKWVQDQYGTLLKDATASPESEARVYQLMGGDTDDEGLEMHNALMVYAAGEDAYTAALTMLKDNVPEQYIMQIIKSKYSKAPKAQSLAAPRGTAQVVTGATPSSTPQRAREKPVATMTHRERIARAARVAMARDKGRG